MANLDPIYIFRRVCQDIPAELRRHLIVAGSLAAAYAYRVKLQSQAVNTKDADLVIHPAGNVRSTRELTDGLLDRGWQPREGCTPAPNPKTPELLQAIRLIPPGAADYFIELLNVPVEEQEKPKVWVPVELRDGWYGLPSFKFMGLIAQHPKVSEEGLEYASPAMMALANLLSHPKVTDSVISVGDFAGLRRCAKDLGRVIALAALAGREATMEWVPRWCDAIRTCFPNTWRDHGRTAGNGLREMLEDDEVMEQARKTTESGLLKGRGYDLAALRGFGQRLLVDTIEDLERYSRK